MPCIFLCAEQVDVEAVLRQRRDLHLDEHTKIHRCRTEQELAVALLRMTRRDKAEPFFTLNTSDGKMSFPSGEIVYVRAGHHRFQLILANGSEAHSRTIRCSFAQAMKPLLAHGGFLHCERSVVVNLHYVKQVRESGLLLYDGTLLPYPPSRRKRHPLPGNGEGSGG